MNAAAVRFDIRGYGDEDSTKCGQTLGGHPVLGNADQVEAALGEPPHFFCAVGTNTTRKRVVERLVARGWQPVSLVDPSAILARGVTVGEGSYIAAGVVVSVDVAIGQHVIVNHSCSVGHDAVLEDFVQVCPGGRVSGFVRLEEGAFLGSNAGVAPGFRVGAYAVVGGGSFVVGNVRARVTMLGVPAARFGPVREDV